MIGVHVGLIVLGLFGLAFIQGLKNDLLSLTVATSHNDGLDRLSKSAEVNGYTLQVLGLGSEWNGGDVARSTGGGQKVNILKNELEKFKHRDDLIVLFVDAYDVMFLRPKKQLLEEYEKLGGGVVFSAEGFCWPDKELANQYPEVGPGGKRYLNSGSFMGPASALYKIVTVQEISNTDDDQAYYTKLFLDEKLRAELNMKLDTHSTIFQNLHGTLDDVEVHLTEDTGFLLNKVTDTFPVVVHGNGPIKEVFNSLSNYLGRSWTTKNGCQHCDENTISVDDLEKLPVIHLSINIAYPTPFLATFFARIAALSYPKRLIHLTGYMANWDGERGRTGMSFNETFGGQYRSVVWFDTATVKDRSDARYRAIAYCLAIEDCQFMFHIEGVAQLTNPHTIQHLIKSNRSIIAPLLARRGKLWSNFWGALDNTGFYRRSSDYIDIVERRILGMWNVPYVANAMLMSRKTLQLMVQAPRGEDIELQLARWAREKYAFMWVDNREYFGYLTDASNSTTEHLHNDLWEIFTNPEDWEEQYIRPDYHDVANPNVTMAQVEQPCQDIFRFPLLTDKFCKQLIEEMEFNGQWSDGSNLDPRLEGGYENVPTRDIHMRQVDWEEHWIHVQRKYVYPIQKKIYEGLNDEPWARMNFVVRYRPDEQPSLRPHHDASSYTLNIALNRAGIDYEGGGTRYLRYNCTLTNSTVGWVLTSPGRVTHLHEGLPTTSGTRYIFITFVLP